MLTTRGDYILAENYTFCSAVETAVPLGLKCIGIRMDSEGVIPDALDSALDNWDPSLHDGASKPWLLYTIPTGQNPTGSTQSEQRRYEIYEIAQKHDLYIVEDEPYYFLQMQAYTGPSAPDVPPPSSHEDFLRQLVPSYLSMDTDGRVMRLDSFSKVIAPGARTGWITASEQIVERFGRHSEVSTQNPSGISQLVLFKILEETWGHAGYLEWLMNLRMEYTGRRNIICQACERWLPKEVTEWSPPMAGMFVSPLSLSCDLLQQPLSLNICDQVVKPSMHFPSSKPNRVPVFSNFNWVLPFNPLTDSLLARCGSASSGTRIPQPLSKPLSKSKKRSSKLGSEPGSS